MFDTFFKKVNNVKRNLPVINHEEASLPCYFTPHFFVLETEESTFVSNQPLTLRQAIAILAERSYTYTEQILRYSLEPIEESKNKIDKKQKQEK